MSAQIRLIWFCFSCARVVPTARHCAREATQMYSFDFGRDGRDWTRPLPPPRPEDVLADPDREDDA